MADIKNEIETIKQKLERLYQLIEKNQKNFKDSSTEKPQKKSSSKFDIWSPIFQAVGLLTIFISWNFQNFDEAKWQEKKNLHTYMRSLTQAMESSMNIFDVGNGLLDTYASMSKEANPTIKEMKTRFLTSFCHTINDIRRNAYTMLRMDEENYTDTAYWNLTISVREDSADIIRAALKQDTAELNDIALDFKSQMALGQMPRIMNAINSFDRKIQKHIDNANRKFLFWYIVGSVLLAIAFIRQTTMSWKEFKGK